MNFEKLVGLFRRKQTEPRFNGLTAEEWDARGEQAKNYYRAFPFSGIRTVDSFFGAPDDCFRQADKLRAQAARAEAERSSKIEFWVLIIIGAELITALITLRVTIHEASKQDEVFRKQTTALNTLNDNATKTLGIAQTQEQKIESLAKDQAAAVEKLQAMSDTLRTSLTTNQSQLKILRTQQDDLLAERQKKPEFKMTVEGQPISDKNGIAYPSLVTSNHALVNFMFTNRGNKTANRGTFRLRVSSQTVVVTGNTQVLATPVVPDADNVRTWLLPFDVLRPKSSIPATLDFAFKSGDQPFIIYVSADCDELPVEVSLGAVKVTPAPPVPQ